MLRYVKNGMLLLSVAYIVIGMLLLIMPETSLLWICNIFGVVVLVTGIVCLIQYARIRGTGFTEAMRSSVHAWPAGSPTGGPCWWAASSRRGWASSRWQSRR